MGQNKQNNSAIACIVIRTCSVDLGFLFVSAIVRVTLGSVATLLRYPKSIPIHMGYPFRYPILSRRTKQNKTNKTYHKTVPMSYVRRSLLFFTTSLSKKCLMAQCIPFMRNWLRIFWRGKNGRHRSSKQYNRFLFIIAVLWQWCRKACHQPTD